MPDTFGLPGEHEYEVIGAVRDIAGELGASPAAVALAWVQSQPGITSTIIGARRLDQLEDNLAALEVTLTAGQHDRLDKLSAPELPFPSWANRLAPALQFAGATVDGQTTAPFEPATA